MSHLQGSCRNTKPRQQIRFSHRFRPTQWRTGRRSRLQRTFPSCRQPEVYVFSFSKPELPMLIVVFSLSQLVFHSWTSPLSLQVFGYEIPGLGSTSLAYRAASVSSAESQEASAAVASDTTVTYRNGEAEVTSAPRTVASNATANKARGPEPRTRKRGRDCFYCQHEPKLLY